MVINEGDVRNCPPKKLLFHLLEQYPSKCLWTSLVKSMLLTRHHIQWGHDDVKLEAGSTRRLETWNRGDRTGFMLHGLDIILSIVTDSVYVSGAFAGTGRQRASRFRMRLLRFHREPENAWEKCFAREGSRDSGWSRAVCMQLWLR